MTGAPEAIIDISSGRQLLADRSLIARTDLELRLHTPKKRTQGPVFFPQTPWEMEPLPVAAPKSGGIWRDSSTGLYRMWYEAGWLGRLAYAQSADGIHWERPELDAVPGTNLVFPLDSEIAVLCPDGSRTILPTAELRMDSVSIWPDPAGGWLGFFRRPSPPGALYDRALVAHSDDGLHWDNFRFTAPIGDRSTVFCDPFRGRWVYALRDYDGGCRIRRFRACRDLLAGADWSPDAPSTCLRCGPDEPNPYGACAPQVYNTDAQPYESLMLGMLQIWYGPDNETCLRAGMPKRTELQLMLSRGGESFTRLTDRNLICASDDPDAWDRGYIQSVTGGIIPCEDETRLYYVGFRGDPNRITDSERTSGMYSGGALGVATLRRDGFVSARTESSGALLTETLRSDHTRYLFVNMDGALQAELLDADGTTLARSAWQELRGTRLQVAFPSGAAMPAPKQPFRIRFHIRQGSLYSFWMTDSPTGDSCAVWS